MTVRPFPAALSRAIACAMLVVSYACSSAPARPHESLSANAEPLRTHFNRDAGHLRIVILAAPT